ncbi:hypothetical protein ACP4OV_014593 [Aristida adscensionis]
MAPPLPSRVHLRLLRLVSSRPSPYGPGLGLRRLSSHAAAAAAAAEPYGEHHHRQEEGSGREVRVTVWWDFHKCRLPQGVDACRLAPRVTAALRRAGVRGPVEITAFGDVNHLQRAEQEALAATGVAFSHVPSSGKDGSDRSIMTDLIYWIAQNPPPAHFFLISADKEFANVLHRLRMSNYNILLASPDAGSRVIRSAATYMWTWDTLAKGGHGDDLLLKPKNPALMALPQNTKVPEVPKSVVSGIKRVLRFYPKGVSIPNLRAELKRINVYIDKELFGFKKFSALLKAIPDVVKFIDPLPGDSQPTVVGVLKRSTESSRQRFNRTDSARSSMEEEALDETESEEASSWGAQSSMLELLACTEKDTVETGAPSSTLDKSSRDQVEAPAADPTAQLQSPSNRVEADVTLAADVPSAQSDTSSRDERNALAVDPVRLSEPAAAVGTPSPGTQGSNSKKGLFERISSLWNGQGR